MIESDNDDDYDDDDNNNGYTNSLQSNLIIH